MWNWLHYLRGENQCIPIESQFTEYVGAQSTRTGQSSDKVLADLRDALELASSDDDDDDAGLPEHECLDAEELHQLFQVGRLPDAREQSVATCSLCKAMVAWAHASPERVQAIAKQLANGRPSSIAPSV